MRCHVSMIVHDRYPLARLCLASLIRFKPEDAELCVFDDGSRDVTLKEYLAGLSSKGVVKLYTADQNRGVGAMRHWACDEFLASGAEFMIQVDGDMLVGPGACDRMVQTYEEASSPAHPIGMLGCSHARPPKLEGKSCQVWRNHGAECAFLMSRAIVEEFGNLFEELKTGECRKYKVRIRQAKKPRATCVWPLILMQHMGANWSELSQDCPKEQGYRYIPEGAPRGGTPINPLPELLDFRRFERSPASEALRLAYILERNDDAS